MSTYIQRCLGRLIVMSATGAAVAALVRVMRRGHRHPRLSASRSADTTAEAALQMAGGAMSNEGGPPPNR